MYRYTRYTTFSCIVFRTLFQNVNRSATFNPQFPFGSRIIAPVVPNVGPLSTVIEPPQILYMTPLTGPQINTNLPILSLSFIGSSITDMRLPDAQIAGMPYPLINMLPTEPPLPTSSSTHTFICYPQNGRLNLQNHFKQ